MGSKSGDLHLNLFRAYQKRYPEKTAAVCQQNVNELWLKAKKSHKDEKAFTEFIEEETRKLNVTSTAKKATLLNFFVQSSKQSNSTTSNKDPVPSTSKSTPSDDVPSTSTGKTSNAKVPEIAEKIDDSAPIPAGQKRQNTPALSISDDSDQDDAPLSKRSYTTPKQNALKTNIGRMERELVVLFDRRDAGLEEEGLSQKIKKARKALEEERKKLKSVNGAAERSQKRRDKEKRKIKQVIAKFPEAANILHVQESRGRPRTEEEQSGLLEAICGIASFGGLADPRRRSEEVRSCKTLSDLHDALLEQGFKLARSTAYLRLLPRKVATLEGKRHVVTVPVKLRRAQADFHKEHEDQHFCQATINSLESVASALSPNQVCFLAQDDKARVPIGVTAAKSQAPALMHMNYRITLPDHDWVVARGHKLIPSVYAGIVIKPDGMGKLESVTYSGPTFIAIRSGKHSSSTAATHANDFEKLINIDDFAGILKTDDGKVKPVMIMTVDGGPDENPRYKEVVKFAAHHFKTHDLDGLFVATNAPGRSAYNRAERRMAPLSKELSGLILPHDQFGSHLDANRNTIDEALELKNFQNAGTTLAEVWTGLIIDGHNVHAEYVPPGEELIAPNELSPEWYVTHIRESQYMLQIIKCQNQECCGAYRSDLRNLLYNGFLPAPYPVKSCNRMEIPDPADHQGEKFVPLLLRLAWTLKPSFSSSKELPYDWYCPSLRNDILSRQCTSCGVYFASKTSLQKHRKGMHPRTSVDVSRVRPLRILSRRPGERLCLQYEDGEPEWVDIEDIEDDSAAVPEDDGASRPEIITNIPEWITSGDLWTED